MGYSTESIRMLTSNNLSDVKHLLQTSEYTYQRFTLEELPMLLERYPAIGIFNGISLRCCLLSQTVNPPTAWIGGFGVSWAESRVYLAKLKILLDRLEPSLLEHNVHDLYYSGNDVEHDWLRQALLTYKFLPYCILYAYDKTHYTIPTEGNQHVVVRPLEPGDIPALVRLEEACFEPLWRYDAISFKDTADTHPYFVVAELQGTIVGYQFNALDSGFGYLVRIAVHPAFGGQGVGTRLMAEAIRFFEKARVDRIMLNTQDDNVYAHSLYERFGFTRIQQQGFVLRKVL